MLDLNVMKKYFGDLPLLIMIILLAGVSAAFIYGVVAYPLGWLVLVVLIYLRIAKIRRKQAQNWEENNK